jgi:hypothetical protein
MNPNIRRPTSNIEHPTSNDLESRAFWYGEGAGYWIFDVGCWVLDVFLSDVHVALRR